MRELIALTGGLGHKEARLAYFNNDLGAQRTAGKKCFPVLPKVVELLGSVAHSEHAKAAGEGEAAAGERAQQASSLCALLRNVASFGEAKDECVRAHVVGSLVRTLEKFRESKQVVVDATAALCNLASKHELGKGEDKQQAERCTAFNAPVNPSAVPALIGALQRWQGEDAVCARVCSTLAHVVKHGGGGAGKAARRLAEPAIPLFVGALRAHAGSELVCQDASALLADMALGGPSDADAIRIRNACVDAGAAEALVAALNAHVGTPRVCEKVCNAISNIAYGEPVHDDRVRGRRSRFLPALPSLKTASIKHGQDAAVREHVMGTLAYIFGEDATALAGYAGETKQIAESLAGFLKVGAKSPVKELRVSASKALDGLKMSPYF